MLSKLVKFLIKTFNPKIVMAGVPAIIKNPEGKILLGKRGKDAPYYPDTWGLPGGMIEYNETIKQAIKRELKEEMGINSEVIKYAKPIMFLPTKECPIQSVNTPVYCKIKGIPKPVSETSEIRWFKPEEIKNMKLAYSHKEILKQEKII